MYQRKLVLLNGRKNNFTVISESNACIFQYIPALFDGSKNYRSVISESNACMFQCIPDFV